MTEPGRTRPGWRGSGDAPRRPRRDLLAPPFLTLLAFLVIEYGRPQDYFTFMLAVPLGTGLIALLAIQLVPVRQRVPFTAPHFILYLILLLFGAVWTPLAVNNYWAYQITLGLGLYYVFSLAVVTFVDTPRRLRIFITVWVLALGYQAQWGIRHDGMGSGSFMGDENDFALAMNLCLPFALVVASSYKATGWRLLLRGVAVLCLIAVFASQSRGGLVGLLATGTAMILFSRRRVAILALAAVAAVVAIYTAPASYWEEMSTITDTQDATRQERYRFWGIATRAWKDNPIFGVGPGNINWRIADYEGDWDDRTSRSLAGHAVHSLYYTLLPELGLFGVFLYGGMLFVAGRTLLRVIRAPGARSAVPLADYGRAVICAMGAYLACGIFLSVLYYPHFYFLTALSFALFQVRGRMAAAPRQKPVRPLPTTARELVGSGR
jgi:probable O-glycosylation ligase (exosortase A-associated)